jgi:hypothetical protein
VKVVPWAELEWVWVGWKEGENIGQGAGDVEEFFNLEKVSMVDEGGDGSIPVRCRGLPCLIARIGKSLRQGLGKYPLGIGSSCLDHRNSNSNNHFACSTARPSFAAIVDWFLNRQFDSQSS